MQILKLAFFIAASLMLIASGISTVDAADPVSEVSARELLHRFRAGWDESQWTQKSRRAPDGYMRATGESSWKLRMKILQGLVRHGASAVPVLTEALTSESAPERILAAQALGYLKDVPVVPLRDAAASDLDPAVRLYAVDSLGMHGYGSPDVDWKALLDDESNRDVRKHINYAIARKGEKIDSAIITRLIEWQGDTMDTARVDEIAPNFTLTSAAGETVTLRDFRGEKAVVLVFVYGDT